MTDNKEALATPEIATAALTPEAQASARIKDLQAAVAALQKDCRTLEGLLANRNPQALERLNQENEKLRARAFALETALGALMIDSLKPRLAEEEKAQFEILRQATVEYCKKANVDPEIWKNLVS